MTKPYQQTQVQHTVLFEFRDDISQDQIDEVFRSIVSFKTQEKIPGILSISYGPHNSPEGLNQGFNYGMTMRFESVEARDAYIPHPEHKKVVDMILPLVKNGANSVIAVDWYLTGDNEIE
ncbi:MAG: Dabb family protein [Halothece sp.]